VRNAYQYAQNKEPGRDASKPAAETFVAYAATLPAEPKPARSKFYLEDEDEMEQTKETQWTIPQIIPANSTILLTGATGFFKSFLALDICLSIATGVEIFGSKPAIGPTVYSSLEGRNSLKLERRRAWKTAHDYQGPIRDFFVNRAPHIAYDDTQEYADQIRARLNGRKPRLIVLDTLAKCISGLDENSALDVGKFIGFCDGLAEAFGCSVMALHHTGHTDNKRARGSSALPAGFDTLLRIEANRQAKTLELWVDQHKDAPEPEAPFTLRGRAIGKSLVFFPTTPEEHKRQSGQEHPLSPSAVGRALICLTAIDDLCVTGYVLAGELRRNILEDAETRHLECTKLARQLAQRAQGPLASYVTREGKELRWRVLSQDIAGTPAAV
jgi:hypothetical protein